MKEGDIEIRKKIRTKGDIGNDPQMRKLDIARQNQEDLREMKNIDKDYERELIKIQKESEIMRKNHISKMKEIDANYKLEKEKLRLKENEDLKDIDDKKQKLFDIAIDEKKIYNEKNKETNRYSEEKTKLEIERYKIQKEY